MLNSHSYYVLLMYLSGYLLKGEMKSGEVEIEYINENLQRIRTTKSFYQILMHLIDVLRDIHLPQRISQDQADKLDDELKVVMNHLDQW